MPNGEQNYRRYLTGDNDGLTKIVTEYRDGLTLYLRSIVGDLETASELAEDTFVKLALAKPSDKGLADFKTWLYTIGRNLALDRLRKLKRSKGFPLDEFCHLTDDAQDLLDLCVNRERVDELHAAMKLLSSDHRQVLWLKYFEGQTSAQVGEIMHKSPQAVDVMAHRARKELKKELEKRFEEKGINYENA